MLSCSSSLEPSCPAQGCSCGSVRPSAAAPALVWDGVPLGVGTSLAGALSSQNLSASDLPCASSPAAGGSASAWSILSAVGLRSMSWSVAGAFCAWAFRLPGLDAAFASSAFERLCCGGGRVARPSVQAAPPACDAELGCLARPPLRQLKLAARTGAPATLTGVRDANRLLTELPAPGRLPRAGAVCDVLRTDLRRSQPCWEEPGPRPPSQYSAPNATVAAGLATPPAMTRASFGGSAPAAATTRSSGIMPWGLPLSGFPGTCPCLASWFSFRLRLGGVEGELTSAAPRSGAGPTRSVLTQLETSVSFETPCAPAACSSVEQPPPTKSGTDVRLCPGMRVSSGCALPPPERCGSQHGISTLGADATTIGRVSAMRLHVTPFAFVPGGLSGPSPP
mmetsp:Transcript_79659/g.225266  ORF Transcript_79659/g.225266 Transcript_79659/m.225266 type:complete len:394 (+) Transcript_79659:120-1301(+)